MQSIPGTIWPLILTLAFLTPFATANSPTTRPAAVPLQQLHVAGNQLCTPDGKPVWLQGVNISRLSNTTGEGERILESVEAAISWKINFFRLPLNQEMWFGKNTAQKDGGQGYRKLVDQVIQRCTSSGVYVMIDLHWSNGGTWGNHTCQRNMPDKLSEEFWQEIAKTYGNNPAILFDLYNEPKDITWDIWENGGTCKESDVTYTTCGFQKLIEEIRSAGAKNVLVVGGLDWGYDLSGVLQGYALHDPNGNGIAYSTHIYEFKKNWQRSFLDTSEKHPVIVGEVGTDPVHFQVYKDLPVEDSYTWAPDMMGLIQEHKLHWAAWCFHPIDTPKIVQDWTFTPTPYWGTFVRTALQGGRFQCTHVR